MAFTTTHLIHGDAKTHEPHDHDLLVDLLQHGVVDHRPLQRSLQHVGQHITRHEEQNRHHEGGSGHVSIDGSQQAERKPHDGIFLLSVSVNVRGYLLL
jgi:hypothetical protein